MVKYISDFVCTYNLISDLDDSELLFRIIFMQWNSVFRITAALELLAVKNIQYKLTIPVCGVSTVVDTDW